MSLKKIKNIDYLENQIKIWKPTKLSKKQKEAGNTDDLVPVQVNKKLIIFKKKKNEK
jgi:hypothetical protein